MSSLPINEELKKILPFPENGKQCLRAGGAHEHAAFPILALARFHGLLEVDKYHRGSVQSLNALNAHDIYLVLDQRLVAASIPYQAFVGNVL